MDKELCEQRNDGRGQRRDSRNSLPKNRSPLSVVGGYSETMYY